MVGEVRRREAWACMRDSRPVARGRRAEAEGGLRLAAWACTRVSGHAKSMARGMNGDGQSQAEGLGARAKIRGLKRSESAPLERSRTPDGHVIGAIGVCGASWDENDHCAKAAISGTGLMTVKRLEKRAVSVEDDDELEQLVSPSLMKLESENSSAIVPMAEESEEEEELKASEQVLAEPESPL